MLFAGVCGVACSCDMGGNQGDSGCGAGFPGADSSSYGGYGASGGSFGGFGGSFGGTSASGGDASTCSPDAGVAFTNDPDGGCVPNGCVFGFGDCNAGAATDGCETDLSSSSVHCGACGQSCEEQTCSFGSCHQPEQILWEVASEVTAMAVLAGDLYFASTGKWPRLGVVKASGSESYLAPLSEPVVRIEVHGELLIFESEWGLETFDLAQHNQAHVLPSPLFDAWASDGSSLFTATELGGATAWDGGYIASDAALVDASVEDADVDAPAPDAASDAQTETHVVFETRPVAGGQAQVFWEEGGHAGAMTVHDDTLFAALGSPGRLLAFSTSNLQPALLATGDFQASAIGVDAGYVYLADQPGSRILRVSTSGGSVETLTNLPRAAFDLRVDTGTLWFVLPSPAELWEQGTVSPKLLAGLLREQTPFAVDATHVYWSSPGVGVFRIAR